MDSYEEDFLAVPVCYMTGWQHELDLISHVCQFTNNIIFLEGPPLAGRTSFLRFLAANNPTNLHCQYLDGGMVDSVAALMHEIAECFGLKWQGANQIVQQFSEQLSFISTHDTWVLLVDDADQLSNQLWLALIDLACAQPDPQKNIHLVLSGDIGFAQRLLDTVEARRIVKTHIVQLTPLSEAECERFYHHIAQHMGVDAELIPMPKRQQLYQQSRGIPGVYKQLITQLLQGQPTMSVMPESQQPAQTAASPSSGQQVMQYFSATNILFGFVSLGFFVVLFSLLGQGEGAVSGDVSLQLSENALVVSESDLRLGKDKLVAEQEFQSKLAAAMQELKQEAQTELAAPEKELATLNEPSEVTQEVTRLSRAVQVAPAIQETTAASPRQATVSVTPKTDLKVNSEAIVAFSPHESRLLTQPANHYTIQVLAVSTEANAEAFVSKARGTTSQTVGYYRRIRQGKSWYVVTLGSYNTKQEAQAAIGQLNDAVGLHKPFVRTFSPIHAEIQATAQLLKSQIS